MTDEHPTVSPTQADHIIGLFGGVPNLAKALEHKHYSTVQGWKDRGKVPHDQWPAIIEAGTRVGVKVKREDFVAHLPADDEDGVDLEQEPHPHGTRAA